MRLIVTSQTDIAGTNIYNRLREDFGFAAAGQFEGRGVYKKGGVTLISTEKNQVEADHLDTHFNPEFYVFASRHRSLSNEKTLTAHTPGNLTREAKVGGNPEELAYAAPDPLKRAFLELKRGRDEGDLDYKVSLEVTHHGPTSLQKPVMFVEVGSTEDEWNDSEAVALVARASVAAAENTRSYEKGIGIGGSHYAPRHSEYVLRSDSSLGHMIPSYSLDLISPAIFADALKKSGATFCFLDWKGMRRDQREKVLKWAGDLGVEVRKRIGERKTTPRSQKIFSINREIFSHAERLDSLKLRRAITDHGGTPIDRDGHIVSDFYAPRDIRVEVLKACIETLRSKNPVLAGQNLILEEERFDPEKAQDLGLKPGPLFSALKKDGEVEIGNKKIRYDDVVVYRKKIIKLDEETVRILKSFI